MNLVIDASIAIKWVISEEGTDAALRLRQHQLFAPDLLIPECASILWKKVRRQELAPAEALLAAQALERVEIQLEPMRPLLEPATRLAIALNHPAYDCVYLALALAINCDFITADEALFRRASMTTLAPQTRMLDDPLI